jgi:hypothetical protein
MLVQLIPGRKATAPHSVYPLVKTPSLKARGQDSIAAVPRPTDRRCARLDGPPQIPSTTNLAHRGAGCPSCAGLIWTCRHQERSAVRLGRPRPGGAGPGGTAGRGRDLPRLLYYRFHRGYIAAQPAPGKVGETSRKRNGEDQPTGASPTGQVWHLDIHYGRPATKYSCSLIVVGVGYGAHASPVTRYYQLPCAPRDPPIQPTSEHTLSPAAQLWYCSALGHSRQFCPNPSLRSDERVAI